MPGTRSLSNLSPRARTLVGSGALVQLVLLFVALRDLRARPADQVRGSKALWLPALFVNFIGPVAYLRFGRRR